MNKEQLFKILGFIFLALGFIGMICETKIFPISSMIMALTIVWCMSHTIFHEIGHAVLAKFFNPKNKVKIKIGIKNGGGSDISGGRTYVSDNFLNYSDGQIKIIACAGYAFQIVYTVILSVISFQFCGLITPSIFLFFFNISVICFNISVSFNNKGYCDENIIRDPKGFKDYMRALPNDSPRRFENVV